MDDIVIRVEGVYKRFGTDTVLNNVSRSFERGRIHGIVGNNGSGKTVLMKCICGFLIPTEGEVIVNGKRVGKDVDFPPGLGLIIETPGFLP
ncbi:MAG: ATP-binding cassette domain-containing protein, partial [Christensenellales bacterium]